MRTTHADLCVCIHKSTVTYTYAYTHNVVYMLMYKHSHGYQRMHPYNDIQCVGIETGVAC